MQENVIETVDLCKVYKKMFRPGFHALRDLTISVPRGAVFGFLGPNGAGKTTTIKILMDLIKATSGTAKVLGVPSTNVEVKGKIGFLPDSPAFSPQLSAQEFLSICSKLLKIPSNVRAARIKEVLADVRMSDRARDKIGSFSRGMLQRIGVAQALLNRPELLILDEPLLGLDPFGRQEFKEIIMEQRSNGATVFFSSHILSDVEEICDRIAILKKGELLCCGRIDELLASAQNRVVLAPDHDKVLQELILRAESAVRREDGSWELSFAAEEGLAARLHELEEKHPGAVQLSSSRENLEDYFFKMLGEKPVETIAESVESLS